MVWQEEGVSAHGQGGCSTLSHRAWVMGREEETDFLCLPSLAEVVVLYFTVVSGFSVGRF